ncbi:MAG: hypothetical protein JXQ99_27820 [Hyphomicrobiaceae bacterium]
MATFELDAPHAGVATDFSSRIKRYLGHKLRAMQYARMAQCMRQMSDEQLESLELTRADIPRYARECIYGDQENSQ